MKSLKYYFAEADIRRGQPLKESCIQRYGAVGNNDAIGYAMNEEPAPDELSRILSHAGLEPREQRCDEIEQIDEPMVDQIDEGRMAEVDQIFQDIANGDMDIYELYQAHATDPVTKYAQDQLMNMYDEVAREYRLHPDDDFEDILDLVAQQIEQDYENDESVPLH